MILQVRIADTVIRIMLSRRQYNKLSLNRVEDFTFSGQSYDGLLKIIVYSSNLSGETPPSPVHGRIPICRYPSVAKRLASIRSGEEVIAEPDQLRLFNSAAGTQEVFTFDSLNGESHFLTAHIFLAFASLLTQRRSLIIHGAGFSIESRGAVIIGPSGAGKSTASNLVGRDFLLSDDVVAITGIDSLPLVHSTPLGGSTDGNRSAALSAIFFPEKGNTTSLTLIPPRQALLRFMQEHSDYVSRLFKPHMAEVFKSAHALFHKVPAYELSFTKNHIDPDAIQQVLLLAKTPTEGL